MRNASSIIIMYTTFYTKEKMDRRGKEKKKVYDKMNNGKERSSKKKRDRE